MPPSPSRPVWRWGPRPAPASAASHGGIVNNQAGLVIVNVQLEDVTINVPIAAAVALCDTNVTILGLTIDGDATTCTAIANATA